MQYFRLLPAVVVIAFASSAVLTQADDTDTSAQAAARAALMEKMNEMDTEQPPGSTSVPMTPPEQSAPPAEQSTPPAVPPPAMVTPPVTVTGTNEAVQYPVNPPVNQQVQTGQPITIPPPETIAPALAQTPAPVPMKQPAVSTNVSPVTPSPAAPPLSAGFAPIVAPPLPITQEKQSALQALLAQYMANQVTPEQYQEQRAKILAQP